MISLKNIAKPNGLKRAFVFVGACCALLVLVANAHAWSRHVHANIADVVQLQLSPEEMAYYEALVEAMPQAGLGFRDLSPWVDSVRGEPIKEVYKGQVPVALRAFQSRHSATWHYQNAFYFRDVSPERCHLEDKGQLEAAFLALHAALGEPNLSAEQEAITLAFAIHLLEDAHQPLHTTALVREDCSHDRGGNLYCLQHQQGVCISNLHQVWDAGFGVSQRRDFQMQQVESKQSLPVSTLLGLILAEGEMLAPEVYRVEENRAPPPQYLKQGATISEARLQKAVARQVWYLKQHYERRH